MKTGIQIMGDWKKEVGVPLHDLLKVLTEVTGRTGYEACKYCIISMAQSMRALTPQSKKKRKIEHDSKFAGAGGDYVTTFHKGKESRFYRFHFMRDADADGTWEQAQQIKNQGLAKRSWMWGLKDLQAAAGSRPMSGVADVRQIIGEKSCGLILTDRLSYLMKILPAGWQEAVVRSAGNKIMHNVARKMEQRWLSEIRRARRSGTAVGMTLARAFRSAA